METYMVVVGIYVSEFQAGLAKATLEGSGIDAVIRKDDCGGMRPYLQASTGVNVLVRRSDARRARGVLGSAEDSAAEESAGQ